MLKIFNQSHKAVGYIKKYRDCKIESVLSTAEKTLSFTYLGKAGKIDYEYYIQTPDAEYVVKAIRITSDGYPEYTATLNMEELEAKTWETFLAKDSSLRDTANLALAGTGWRVAECTVDKKRSMGLQNVTSKVVLQKICTVFMCEMQVDSKAKTVSFKEKFGEDKGVYFLQGLNLRKLTLSGDTYDFYTRIIPVGKDGLKITAVNDGKEYIDNFQYSKKIIPYIWQDTSYEDATAMMEDATEKLKDLSIPKKSYTVDVRDLAYRSAEYSILEYGLGDTITLIDRKTGIRDTQRITKIVEYPGNPDKNTCDIANTRETFDEIQSRLKEAASIIEAVKNLDGSINGNAVDKVTTDQILGFKDGVESGIQTSNTISGIKTDIKAVTADIGTIQSTYLKAADADIKFATIENLKATTATIHDLNVDYAKFKTATADEFAAKAAQIEKVTGDLADYKKVVTRELITAKGWMAEGAIGDAQISTLTANKIRAGTIDTSLVTVASKDGKLQISDNTIQIKDSDRVRVQMGKDESGDYTLAVWDAAGKLIWDALGATENTIQRKIIRDNVVADDANIQGYKLDINSVVRSLNGADETISSTIVQVGNKFLNVLLEEQNNEILAQGENLVAQAAQIKANQDSILLKVSTQKFESYQRNVDSHLSTLDSSITSMKGQIVLKVEQTDIDTTINKVQVGGRNLIRNSKTLVFDNYGFGSPNSTKYMDENGNTLTDENGNILIE